MSPHDIPHDLFDNQEPVEPSPAPDRALRIGVGGPVGSGKTTLVGALCRLLRDEMSVVVVTNDIFTSEDAMALREAAVLPADRIVAVETGCCPHTAIRDDIAANLDAVEQLELLHDDVDLTLVESGGDNLTAIFSRGLVDAQIFVIDTAGGDDVPRKGGPGVALADLLVINKVDLAPFVHADVDLMLRDATARRDGRPVLRSSLVTPEGAVEIADWIRHRLQHWRMERVRASATIAVARCGDRNVVVNQRCAAPFSIRQCGDRILLASSAAAPVGGDELQLDVDVGPGARAAIGSVAASIAWPGVGGANSSMTTMCTVGRGAHLGLWPEPTMSVAGSRHRTVTVVRLGRDATCQVVEEVVLGRSNQVSGHLDLSMRVERSGRPLVHHDEAFGPDVAGAWSSVSVGAARHVLSAVLVGVDAGAPRVRVETDRAAAWLPVAGDAAVVMVIGADRPSAMRLFADLSRSIDSTL